MVGLSEGGEVDVLIDLLSSFGQVESGLALGSVNVLRIGLNIYFEYHFFVAGCSRTVF